MPLIECTLIKGYDTKVRQRLAERVTDAACSTIGAAADFVTVTIILTTICAAGSSEPRQQRRDQPRILSGTSWQEWKRAILMGRNHTLPKDSP